MAKGPGPMAESLSMSVSVLIGSSSFCAVVNRPQRGPCAEPEEHITGAGQGTPLSSQPVSLSI